MKRSRFCTAFISFSCGLSALSLAEAQAEGVREPVEREVAELSADFAAEVEIYNDHIVTLASPWMEGRLPGTRGMELAKEYMEFYFKQTGLEAPWDETFRQPFELAPRAELLGSFFKYGDMELTFGTDYTPLGSGSAGTVKGPAVFIGYSLPKSRADDDYESFEQEDDLTGKIAVMFRLEPMNENGDSRLGERWSRRASYIGKISEAVRRGAAAVVMINPPESNHDGAKALLNFRGSGGGNKVPVMHVSIEAGERLLAAMDSEGRSALELRLLSDEGRQVFDLAGELELHVDMKLDKMFAENVGGLLPGKGDLKHELIVIGAHLDHLGQGDFGSRGSADERGRVLHPGADDNASGSAAILMIAERMAKDYAEMDEDAAARSVLFVGFSAEESGLNGSRYYVEHPLVPLEDHALMINFDMIGRILNKRLSLSGAKSGKGMAEFLEPLFENSELDIVQPEGMSGASDHSSFYSRGVPVLFGIIADFHQDYHTPRDVTSKINRVDAVNTVDLFHQIGTAMATHGEGFEFQRMAGNRQARAPRVLFGITLAAANNDPEAGVLVAAVTKGSSADEGGVKARDRILTWNDQELEDARAWRQLLARHSPGDEVKFEVRRGSEVLLLKTVLRAPGR